MFRDHLLVFKYFYCPVCCETIVDPYSLRRHTILYHQLAAYYTSEKLS